MWNDKAGSLETIKGAAWGIFAISIWASWMVITRLDLVKTDLTVFDITAIRFGTAAILLLPVVLRNGFIARPVGVLGTFAMVSGAGAPYALVAAAGLMFAPAAMAGALIPGVMPLFATMLAFVVLREKPSIDRIVGLALIPVGVLSIVGSSYLWPDRTILAGQALFLSASFMWAVYTVTLRRSKLTPIHGASIVAFWSAALFIPAYVVMPWPKGLLAASAGTIAFEIVFQGILTSVVSLIAFNRAISILGASRGSIFASLVPALTSLLAIPVLGEMPSPVVWFGMTLISSGVLLGTGSFSKYFRRNAGPRGA